MQFLKENRKKHARYGNNVYFLTQTYLFQISFTLLHILKYKGMMLAEKSPLFKKKYQLKIRFSTFMAFSYRACCLFRTRNQEIFGQKLADYAVDCLWILVIVMQ